MHFEDSELIIKSYFLDIVLLNYSCLFLQNQKVRIENECINLKCVFVLQIFKVDKKYDMVILCYCKTLLRILKHQHLSFRKGKHSKKKATQ